MRNSLVIRPKIGPVNRPMIMAGVLAVGAYTLWPNAGSPWEFHTMPIAMLMGTTSMTITGIKRLIRDFELRRNLAVTKRVTCDHGSARQATAAERTKARMDSHQGDLLGLDDDGNPVFSPADAVVKLVDMGPGIGKTSCLVINSIFNQALNGKSVLVFDPKCELAVMLTKGLQSLGVEVWWSNPTGQYLKFTGDVELNPYQALLDAVYAEDSRRKDAPGIAADYAATHYPAESDTQNPYFNFGSRRVIGFSALSEAIINPAGCTPTAVYNLVADPSAFIKRLKFVASKLEGLNPDDTLISYLKTEARGLLTLAKTNDENLGAFLEGASQRLLPYSPAGHLGHYGTKATHSISEMRDRRIVNFVITCLSHMREFAAQNALSNHNVIAACKAKPDGHPLHICAEEALNFKIPELASSIETLRGLGVTIDIFIQSFAGLEKVYGKDTAQAIESMADVRMYAGTNSGQRAKYLSDMLSDTTVRKSDYSYATALQDINVANGEIARPLQKTNEILATERGRAWLFVRGMNPMSVRLVPYSNVHPFRDLVGNSPLTGTRLYGETLVTINYPEKEKRHA